MSPAPKKILLIQGHPDPNGTRFGHALLDAYLAGATKAGHATKVLSLASLDFPLLRGKEEWESGAVPAVLQPAQEALQWAEHIVLFFPLWLGGMPALTKAFFEQVLRPGFAIGKAGKAGMPAKLLQGRSARLVVTMGMPALVYRYYFRAHSLRALERNILGFVGISPVHETLIGLVESMPASGREGWLRKLGVLGAKGD